MNEINVPGTSPVPPTIPSLFPASTPLGEHPDDRVPIAGPVSAIEAMLRQPRRMIFQLRQSGAPGIIGGLIFVSALCAIIYGVVVGTFSGGAQLWIAPVKIAGGILVCALICLPSLYIFSCLAGSQARLIEVLGLVVGLLALTTILLIGFAPVAWVFSQSTTSLAAMGALHLAFWIVATFFGWRFLRNGFTHLSAHSGGALYVWLFIFVLVCVQMTTALRPIIGTSDTFLPKEKKFFLAHWIDVMEAKPATNPTVGGQR
jgi:hypothetical protein